MALLVEVLATFAVAWLVGGLLGQDWVHRGQLEQSRWEDFSLAARNVLLTRHTITTQFYIFLKVQASQQRWWIYVIVRRRLSWIKWSVIALIIIIDRPERAVEVLALRIVDVKTFPCSFVRHDQMIGEVGFADTAAAAARFEVLSRVRRSSALSHTLLAKLRVGGQCESLAFLNWGCGCFLAFNWLAINSQGCNSRISHNIKTLLGWLRWWGWKFFLVPPDEEPVLDLEGHWVEQVDVGLVMAHTALYGA
mgnify:CR=1 FL=1